MVRLLSALLTFCAVFLGISTSAFSGLKEVPPSFPPFAQVTTHEIRVLNVHDGPIQVSMDGGQTWLLVGRVTIPATQSLPGYLASGYAPPSTVAATAVHGIRIRVGDLNSAYPKMINIIPVEFTKTLKTFGGLTSGDSGIYTNIHTGTGIFRNLAPYVGNKVYLDNDTKTRLPINYRPKIGDTFLIVVKRPANPLTQVVFENKTGGDVTATYADGVSKVVTHVTKPVLGTGRFDGTSYTGVGAINTNHCGVITVSTAPISSSKLLEGQGPERRGGFQIEPAYHNSQSEEAGAPIILNVGIPGHKFTMSQEGKPPLFSGYLNLAWDPQDPKHSWQAEIQRGDGTAWLPMIENIGFHPNSLAGVTAIRLIRDDPGKEKWLVSCAVAASNNYTLEAKRWAQEGKTPIQRGTITIKASDNPQTKVVAFYVDGVLKGLTNSPPFRLTWNTDDSPDGEYLIEAEAENAAGAPVSWNSTKIWVDNAHIILKPYKKAMEAKR